MAVTDQRSLEQYQILHAKNRYGISGIDFHLQMQACILNLRPATVLDYGCGQNDLSQTLELGPGELYRYDPAIPAISNMPVTQADLILNTDVLEHIPAQDLDDVLSHMRSISSHVFFSIATRPSRTILPNGKNAHCTIWPAAQWLEKIKRHFPDSELIAETPHYACTILTWRSPAKGIIAALETCRLADKRRRKPDSALKRWERTLRHWIKGKKVAGH